MRDPHNDAIIDQLVANYLNREDVFNPLGVYSRAYKALLDLEILDPLLRHY